MSTIAWERVSKIIEADALEDLRGHKRLQSPEGQAFLQHLQQWYHTDRTDPLMPWLAREFRKGRLQHIPSESQGNLLDSDQNRGITPGEVRHWGDWYHSPDRRKVPLEQLQLGHMPGEVKAWEKAMADKASAEAHMPHAPEGEVVHRFPDDWTVRKLPSSALPFEGWAMRGKPDSRGFEAPICVGEPYYQRAVDEDKTHIYSLRDPQHMPHTTMELTPNRYDSPPFDFERARQTQLSHPNELKRWPETVFNKLRDYSNNPNWSQLEDQPIGIPGWEHPESAHTMTHGQLFNQLLSIDANTHHRHIPDNGVINQIQGKGNSVPKPEYQARMKDWFSTFPPESRPNWERNQYPVGDIADINPYHPEHEDAAEEEPEGQGEFWDQGGYGPHGDYGLAPPPLRPLNYGSIMDSMPRRVHHGPMADIWDQSDIDALYEHSKARNEIPQLASAVEEYHEKKAMPDLQELEDANYEYLGRYPGEEYEDEPERWDEIAMEQGHPAEAQGSGREAFQHAYDGYNQARDELYQMHAPSQIVDALYQKLTPHHSHQGVNGGPPGYYNFSSETGFAAPQPEQQTYSKTAEVKLAQQLYRRWVFSPGTGSVELADNDGDPIDVRYHTDIARELNEPNLVHGYAYRIGGGWRLLDWDSKPVTDPFVIASVMRQLKASEGDSEPHEGSWTSDRNNDWSRMHQGMPT